MEKMQEIDSQIVENQLLGIAFKSLTLSGESFDKLIYQFWIATGAIAGVVIAQVSTLLNYFSVQGIFLSFLFMLISAVLGLISLYCVVVRKALQISYCVCEANKDLLCFKLKIDSEHFLSRYFSALPLVIGKLGHWYLQKNKKPPKLLFEQSAYWAGLQLHFLFWQALLLISSAVPLMISFNG